MLASRRSFDLTGARAVAHASLRGAREREGLELNEKVHRFVVTGQAHGLSFELELFEHRQHGWAKTTLSTPVDTSEVLLSVWRSGWFSGLGRASGFVIDVGVDDARFDRDFVVEGAPAERIK